MKTQFEDILKNYAQATSETFAEHRVQRLVTTETVKDIIERCGINTNSYKVKGSAGQSKWAIVPWIAVFDKEITTNAEKGYYIVYLFKADMSGFYLSLNQGWTWYNKKYKGNQGIEEINKVSEAWRRKLVSSGDFSFSPITLGENASRLSIGYVHGNICSKYYSFDNIPDDVELASDFRAMIAVYSELKGHIKRELRLSSLVTGESFAAINLRLIRDMDAGIIENTPSENEDDSNNGVVDEQSATSLSKQPIPSDFKPRERGLRSFVPRKVDFIGIAKKQKKLGFDGEILVLNSERQFLIGSGKPELAAKVEHTAVVKGDGAGYDILSYELDGREKYIEVKTTTGDECTPFNVSDAEVEFSEQNPQSYYLYRVYNFSIANGAGHGECFILQGNLNDCVNLIPQNYIADGIKSNLMES